MLIIYITHFLSQQLVQDRVIFIELAAAGILIPSHRDDNLDGYFGEKLGSRINQIMLYQGLFCYVFAA
jgi:hypothetical protein